MEGPNAVEVIFSVRGVFGDRVGLDTGRGNGDWNGSGDGFLGEREGERLIDGFWGGDGGGGDEGDGDSGGDVVGHSV